MQAYESLIDDAELTNPNYSRCFWISYSLFIFGAGALTMWLFFKFVILN